MEVKALLIVYGLLLILALVCSDSVFAAGKTESQDPPQRAIGFPTLAGGVIITFTKEIFTMITG